MTKLLLKPTLFALLVLGSGHLAAEPPAAIATAPWTFEKTLTASDVLPYLNLSSQSTAVGLPSKYEVDGERKFSGGLSGNAASVLAADEIVFHPGSVLILQGPYGGVGKGERAIIILARKITVIPGPT